MISIILGLYVGILGIPFIERVSSPLYDFIVVTQRTTLCNMIAYKTGFLDMEMGCLTKLDILGLKIQPAFCTKNPSTTLLLSILI